jgi:histidine ammonia-lyase
MDGSMSRTITIDGESLTPLAFHRIVSRGAKAELARSCRDRVQRAAEFVREVAEGEESVYGVNTGFGELVRVRIPASDARTVQENLILSHAAGVGEPLDRESVRALLLLRANSLCRGHSGVRPVVIERLLDLLNLDLLPVVPSRGSVGASGDLAPLAHVALGLLGKGDFDHDGRRIGADEAHAILGDSPLGLEPKEGLALVNGTQQMLGLGLLAAIRAEMLLKTAQIAAAMTVEGLEGSHRPFQENLHRLRPHPGQISVARNLRALLRESEIVVAHAHCGKVQDAYSLRCIPQVLGAAVDVVGRSLKVFEVEMNAVTDNPIVFWEEGEIVSGGNFHGQPIAFALDAAAMALTDAASFSERRTYKLLDNDNEKIPTCLVRDAGINTGLMIVQYTAASLVSECKVLSHPASIDSIPTSAGMEDHVSMGVASALKLRSILDHLETVLAVEVLCAAQALDFQMPNRPGAGAEAGHQLVREHVSHLERDRVLAGDLESVRRRIGRGDLVRRVEERVGPLAGLGEEGAVWEPPEGDREADSGR